MARFPACPDDVTAAWLTERARNAGLPESGSVSDFAWTPIGTGQVGDSVRFSLQYEGSEGPATLAGKFPAADATSRSTAAAFGLYTKEVGFYRDLAPLIDVRVPRALASVRLLLLVATRRLKEVFTGYHQSSSYRRVWTLR